MNKILLSNSIVLSVDPRGIIVSGGIDVITRHQIYGQNLKQITKDNPIKFIAISSGFCAKNYDNDNFTLITIGNATRNFFKFAWQASNIIKKNGWKVDLLIAGDPWESFWSVFILRIILRINAPIQIQIHGDIGNPLWRKQNLVNQIRFLISKFSISRASSLRLVGYQQSLLIQKNFSLKKQIIQVIPIPISVPKNKKQISTKKPISLGFVGRIHSDRGIWDFINLIKKLNKVRSDFSIVIVGQGPETEQFISDLSKLVGSSRIIYFGELSENKLNSAWEKIGVLVSLAPTESYGRAIRESLIRLIPVWVVESSGVKDLNRYWNSKSLKILKLNKSEYSLSQEFDLLRQLHVDKLSNQAFLNENRKYARQMAQFWVNLIRD